MRLKYLSLYLSSFLVVILASCADAPSQPPFATAQPLPSPQAFSLDYSRTGGFIGYNDHLVIDANGHAILTRRNSRFEFDLDRAALKQIDDTFQSTGFATIPENSMPRVVPADGISYVVVYQRRSVRTADSAIPEKIAPVLSLLNGIIEAKGK